MIKNIRTSGFILLLLYNLPIYSQNLNGEATYNYKVKESFIDNDLVNNNEDIRAKKIANFVYKSLINNIEILEFKLKFNNQEALYSMNEVLEDIDGNKEIKYAIIFTKGNETIYLNNKESKKLVKTNTYGDFIVESEIKNLNWKITNTSKKIGGYSCYKATSVVTTKYKKAIITAWFTSEIPISFGPKGYAGLPGLIIELEEGNIIYYASKIKINSKENKKIKRPYNGVVVNEKKYDSIRNEASKNFKKLSYKN